MPKPECSYRIFGTETESGVPKLLSCCTRPVIPSKANESRDSRPVVFDREAYRGRNIVERLIGWLKECRRIFSRFEKTARNFGGMITMAFIQRYLRLLT